MVELVSSPVTLVTSSGSARRLAAHGGLCRIALASNTYALAEVAGSRVSAFARSPRTGALVGSASCRAVPSPGLLGERSGPEQEVEASRSSSALRHCRQSERRIQ